MTFTRPVASTARAAIRSGRAAALSTISHLSFAGILTPAPTFGYTQRSLTAADGANNMSVLSGGSSEIPVIRPISARFTSA
jgi:hypothetical protein